MALFRFLFAPVLLVVAVLAGSGEGRRAPAETVAARGEVASRPAAAPAAGLPVAAPPAAPREVPAGVERAQARRPRAMR